MELQNKINNIFWTSALFVYLCPSTVKENRHFLPHLYLSVFGCRKTRYSILFWPLFNLHIFSHLNTYVLIILCFNRSAVSIHCTLKDVFKKVNAFMMFLVCQGLVLLLPYLYLISFKGGGFSVQPSLSLACSIFFSAKEWSLDFKYCIGPAFSLFMNWAQ